MERQMSVCPADPSLFTPGKTWTFLMALFIRNGDKQETAEWTEILFHSVYPVGKTLVVERIQNVWLPWSKLVQCALSAWNTLLVRSWDLIASFGVGLLCWLCCFLPPDISLPMWPYPLRSRILFLMITNIVFMTFMSCKIPFLLLYTHGSRVVCRLIVSSLFSSVIKDSD